MTAPKRKLPIDLESLARAYTQVSIETLGAWATNKETSEDIRLRAIGMLMDRGWGRPKQDNSHTVQGEVRVILRKMLEDEEEGE